MYELHNNVKISMAVTPFIAGAAGTTNGNTIDMLGFSSLTFVGTAGQVAAGDFDINMQESDDAGTWTNVAAADMLGTEPNFDSPDDDVVKKVSYIGDARYVRVQVVVNSAAGTGGNHVVFFALQGNARMAPNT